MPENPQRIRRESAENPQRIRWESAENPLRILPDRRGWMFSSSLTRLTESSTISQSFLGFPPDSDWISDRGPKKCHRGRRSILLCFIPIINKKSTRRERICFAVPFFFRSLRDPSESPQRCRESLPTISKNPNSSESHSPSADWRTMFRQLMEARRRIS